MEGPSLARLRAPLFAALIFESERTPLASPSSLAVSSLDLYAVLGL